MRWGTMLLLSSIATGLSAPPGWAEVHLWSHSFGDDHYQEAFCVAADGSGDVFITGTFSGTVDFGGGLLIDGTYGSDAFVAKFDASGNHLWRQGFGGRAKGRGVSIDGSGNVGLTGYFSGTVDFGAGPLASAGGEDIYIAKFGADPTDSPPPDEVAAAIRLGRAWPNPTRGSLQVDLALPEQGRVVLRVYDARGRLIRTLVGDASGSGTHIVTWDGLDGAGSPMPAGTYFLRFMNGTVTRMQKITLVR